MKYRYLNEVLLDWNGSENIQDNSIIKSSDIKGLKEIDSYNVNGVKFKMIRMKHIKPTFYLGETLQPVASKEPNEYGLYDMLGNSWEWCLKSHQSSGMSAFVAKGGSYKISPDEMSATNAWGNICSFGGDANGIGIRLALDLN